MKSLLIVSVNVGFIVFNKLEAELLKWSGKLVLPLTLYRHALGNLLLLEILS